MLLEHLALASKAASTTPARNEKISLLATCLKRAEDDAVEIAVAYLSGETRQGRIGVSYSALHRVTATHALRATLTLSEVDAAFAQIAEVKGTGANERRVQALMALFARATELEQAFLRRLLLGELRQGALEGVMLDAIAQAFHVSSAALRRAAMLDGVLSHVASVARIQGEAGLSAIRLQLFRPLQPMLAQSAADVSDIFEKLDQPVMEWKLDGARIQVHREGDEVRVYTRQLNDVTHSVPEIVERVRELPARQLVLDGEAIVLHQDGRPRAFQTTMRRFGRRLDVAELRTQLPLSMFFFDLLHVDGRDLLDEPLSARAQRLAELLPQSMRVERATPADAAAAEAFVTRALEMGHEGIVAKDRAATYEAGRRGAAWLKLKRAHTLDLVVLAAEWGSGRRHGFLSNLHLGARSIGSEGGFVMLGKTFKGMTDELLTWQTSRLLELETHRDALTVYVRPELVVEVAFDGVQASTQYPGGVALRFARIKGYREDKSVAQADTLESVQALEG